MSTYDKIAWLPVCGGVTGLGLVISYLVMRRRGLRSGIRGAAWSLLPLAAYLTGAIEMFWKMGAAIGDFAKGFVFSDRVWSGIALAGLSVVLLVTSGGIRRRRVRQGDGSATVRSAGKTQAAAAGASGALAPKSGTLAVPATGQPAVTQPVSAQPAASGRRGRKAAASAEAGDDDMKDIEDILRRRGIN
jgi:hypothetical protein